MFASSVVVRLAGLELQWQYVVAVDICHPRQHSHAPSLSQPLWPSSQHDGPSCAWPSSLTAGSTVCPRLHSQFTKLKLHRAAERLDAVHLSRFPASADRSDTHARSVSRRQVKDACYVTGPCFQPSYHDKLASRWGGKDANGLLQSSGKTCFIPRPTIRRQDGFHALFGEEPWSKAVAHKPRPSQLHASVRRPTSTALKRCSGMYKEIDLMLLVA